MYIYEIGYHSCEDSSYGQWYHEKQYTKEELFNIVVEGLKVARDVWWEKKEEWEKEAPAKDELHVRIRKENKPHFDDLISNNEAFDQYLMSVGFSRVIMQECISLFGWAEAETPGSWDSYAGEPTGDAQIRLSNARF